MRRLSWLLLPLFACASPPPPAPPPTPAAPKANMAEPAHLPETVRHLVAQKMENHAFEMSNLMWAVLFLDREVAAEIADTIVEEPHLSRPLSKDASELNSHLPSSYFDYQDQLIDSAKKLSAIAKDPAQPGEALANQFGVMTQICVRCHQTYLYEPIKDE
jgi:cytochrome c556